MASRACEYSYTRESESAETDSDRFRRPGPSRASNDSVGLLDMYIEIYRNELAANSGVSGSKGLD